MKRLINLVYVNASISRKLKSNSWKVLFTIVGMPTYLFYNDCIELSIHMFLHVREKSHYK